MTGRLSVRETRCIGKPYFLKLLKNTDRPSTDNGKKSFVCQLLLPELMQGTFELVTEVGKGSLFFMLCSSTSVTIIITDLTKPWPGLKQWKIAQKQRTETTDILFPISVVRVKRAAAHRLRTTWRGFVFYKVRHSMSVLYHKIELLYLLLYCFVQSNWASQSRWCATNEDSRLANCRLQRLVQTPPSKALR